MRRMCQWMRHLGRLTVVLAPWPVKRWMLCRFFGYELHPSARIGLAWVFPRQLMMREGSRIDHFTVAIHLEKLELGEAALVGRGNWITGFPKDPGSLHFRHQTDRDPALIMGAHSAITKNHHLDCTDRIEIGSFTTIAGYQSQFLTHSIDINASRQQARPIRIGHHCFLGTRCIVLGGTSLPDCSVLGAGSLLNKSFDETFSLYAGSPARLTKRLARDAAYFCRQKGFVD